MGQQADGTNSLKGMTTSQWGKSICFATQLQVRAPALWSRVLGSATNILVAQSPHEANYGEHGKLSQSAPPPPFRGFSELDCLLRDTVTLPHMNSHDDKGSYVLRPMLLCCSPKRRAMCGDQDPCRKRVNDHAGNLPKRVFHRGMLCCLCLPVACS